MYTVTHGTFLTPRGRPVTLAYREDTNDFNTLRSCLDEDEYGLADLHLEGTALDVGGHIGGASVALLLDNPRLRVVSIEGVPPNVDLLRENIASLGADAVSRSLIIHAAAGKGKTATIRWAFAGNETADHHAFIGNSLLPSGSTHKSEKLPVVTLAGLVKDHGPFSFMKIDCEGCEYPFLTGPALSEVALIRGEVHADPAPIIEALYPTHLTTVKGAIPAGFEAVRRG